MEWIFVLFDCCKAKFSQFPVPSLFHPICSFGACKTGGILLGQVISQASVMTLKCDLFKVIAVTGGFFHQ